MKFFIWKIFFFHAKNFVLVKSNEKVEGEINKFQFCGKIGRERFVEIRST